MHRQLPAKLQLARISAPNRERLGSPKKRSPTAPGRTPWRSVRRSTAVGRVLPMVLRSTPFRRSTFSTRILTPIQRFRPKRNPDNNLSSTSPAGCNEERHAALGAALPVCVRRLPRWRRTSRPPRLSRAARW